MARKLLVIDDDASIRSIVRMYLEKDGWEIEEASTGEAGIERAKSSVPQAILLDVSLPDGEGHDFCRRLKAERSLERVPVLMMSGHRVAVGERVKGLDGGAVDYLLKPFNLSVLSGKLEALLR